MKKNCNNWRPIGGFTLIELLVVIAIIATLAALLFPAGAAIMRNAAKKRAYAELQQVAHAIESYKAKLNFYPPDNTNNAYADRNLLYCELVGCRRGNGRIFIPLDGSPSIDLSAVLPPDYYGAAGIMNSSANADADEGAVAQTFLKDIKPSNYGTGVGGVRRLGVAMTGPGGSMVGNISPFRYNSSSPTNNPSSYDLWVDIIVSGKTNRISNWSSKPQIL